MKFAKGFLVGAATAAHQVEGNNTHSDFWTMEQLKHSSFNEPSLTAVDHYNRYQEDIKLLANAGLNSYRFSIEWARVEPEKGHFDDNEIDHYGKVLQYCHDNGVTPVVTMHHFSSPKWLISEGGWENEKTVEYFTNYCTYVVSKLGNLMGYVCTINEANMGLQIASISKSIMKRMGITPQVGMNFDQMIEKFMPPERILQRKEVAEAFGFDNPNDVHDFLSVRTAEGDLMTMRAHEVARDAMKKICPHLRIGLTLSLHDLQPQIGGEEIAKKEWDSDFSHYIPFIKNDDFIGVQNYSRKRIDANGDMGNEEGVELTQMDYEFYPKAIGNVIRRVASELPGKTILVTENGIATDDDSRRVEFIKQATEGVQACIADNIPVKGYFYWSLLDNFEWQKGFAMKFGLIAVDRKTQTRYPKPSLSVLGELAEK